MITSDDEYSEKITVTVAWFNDYNGRTYPPTPAKWAHLSDAGISYPAEVDSALKETTDPRLFDHSVFVVPAEDYSAADHPRGFRTRWVIDFEATKEQVAMVRAAAEADR
ncbi:hypothetical protein ACQP10_38390 (plasmid) [Streptosporangium sandarakinum]|uniref:hypothetical protein n=1 Tax=Streptosporangium sandarakinum TaxID=1260955 RepID=UPI003D93FD19